MSSFLRKQSNATAAESIYVYHLSIVSTFSNKNGRDYRFPFSIPKTYKLNTK